MDTVLSRLLTITSLVLLVGCAGQRIGVGHLIIDAVKYPSTAKQPTWIALTQLEPPYEFIHVPVGKGIVTLDPGRYRISHIDFDADPLTRNPGSLRFHGAASERFDVPVDAIQYIGLIKIHPIGSDDNPASGYRVDVSTEPSTVLERACATQPKVMSRLPIRFNSATRS